MDAFMLQARGKDLDDGNVTFVGKWVETPKTAKTIKCRGHRQAAVVDIGKQRRGCSTSCQNNNIIIKILKMTARSHRIK